MAISIELWTDRELVGGTETWWDDIEGGETTTLFHVVSQGEADGKLTGTAK